MGKKDRCAVFGCNNDILVITFFSRNIQRSSLFARKARVNTERVPPGHPIILLKSNKFNMAAVSVKRSITGSTPWGFSLNPGLLPPLHIKVIKVCMTTKDYGILTIMVFRVSNSVKFPAS